MNFYKKMGFPNCPEAIPCSVPTETERENGSDREIDMKRDNQKGKNSFMLDLFYDQHN